jgi:prepilin-type processing-associated H-X9-DG protein
MMLSEALAVDSSLSGQPLNATVCNRLTLNTDDTATDCADPDLVAATAATASITGKNNRCESWLSSRWDHSIYNAYLTPNQKDACGYASINFTPTSGVRRAILKATSQHTGGVNTCYADGSVHFTSENVSLSVWRALSTTDGGESQ